MSTLDVARMPASAGLDSATDPESWVLARCSDIAAILEDISTVTEAKRVSDWVSTLDHATKLRDLNAHAVAETSALRLRAERRIGELIDAERAAGTMAEQGYRPPVHDLGDAEVIPPLTLADYGISHDQAADYAKLARVESDEFEAALEREVVEAVRGVTRAALLRRLAPEPQKARPQGTERFQVDIPVGHRAWLDREREESTFSHGEWLVSAIDEVRANPGMNDRLRGRSRQRRLDWDGTVG